MAIATAPESLLLQAKILSKYKKMMREVTFSQNEDHDFYHRCYSQLNFHTQVRRFHTAVSTEPFPQSTFMHTVGRGVACTPCSPPLLLCIISRPSAVLRLRRLACPRRSAVSHTALIPLPSAARVTRSPVPILLSSALV